jgi:G3E family GTPase
MMKKIPITMITGFLGSGKSTLINRIISENKELKIGLIVNEFGDVKLESQMINKSGDEIVELSNGCMCCVVRSDLISAVRKLIDNVKDINYIIIEASGLSDPVPIAQTFLMQDLENRIRLDSIICVADCLNFEQNSRNFEIAFAQLRFSDIILLSKTDLVDENKIEAIKRLVKEVIPEAAVLENAKTADLDLLIDTSQYSHDEIKELEIEEHGHEEEKEHDEHEEEHEEKHYHHKHEHVDILFFKSEKKINAIKFQKLVETLPASIIRAKGFINFDKDMPNSEMKYILQFVGARRQFMLEDWKAEEKKQTALVFIGKDFDTKKLESDLKACEI